MQNLDFTITFKRLKKDSKKKIYRKKRDFLAPSNVVMGFSSNWCQIEVFITFFLVKAVSKLLIIYKPIILN